MRTYRVGQRETPDRETAANLAKQRISGGVVEVLEDSKVIKRWRWKCGQWVAIVEQMTLGV